MLDWLQDCLWMLGDTIWAILEGISELIIILDSIYPHLGLMVAFLLLAIGIALAYVVIEYEPDYNWLKAELNAWRQRRQQTTEGDNENE